MIVVSVPIARFKSVSFPNRCACCQEPADSELRLATSGGGKRYSISIPHCSACVAHVKQFGSTGGLYLPFLLLTLATLGLFYFLFWKPIYEPRRLAALRAKLGKPTCAHMESVRFSGIGELWFVFHNDAYGEAFVAANQSFAKIARRQ